MDDINSETEELKQLFRFFVSEVKNLKKETQIPARLLSFEEVMGILGVSKTKLYDLVAKQEIPCVRIDRHIRFDKEDIAKFIELKKKESFNFEINVNGLRGIKYLKK